MKWLIGSFLVGLGALAGLYSLILGPLPERSGTQLELDGLGAEVQVLYDERGIPAIHAQSEDDAYRALGFIQAQHRLFHMDLNRRLGCGRLAEIFGERAVGVDSYFRTLGIREFARTKSKDPKFKKTDAYRLSMAYIEGINAYIADGGRSLDYWVADVEPQPFGIEDLICVNGNLAHNFAKALSDDFLTSHIWSTLGPDYAKDLVYTSNPVTMAPSVGPEKGQLSPAVETDASLLKLAADLRGFRETFPVGWLEGSNAWVMSASKANMPAPVMVNDPHIGFGLPSVWFEAALITPKWKKHGFFLSGVPFAVLGHDENVAWGLTMLQNDDMDFFVETCADEACTQYKSPSGEQAFEERIERIDVKDAEAVDLRVRLSRHGPIMNDVLETIGETRPIAMQWSFVDKVNEGFETFLKLNRAKNLAEFEKAVGSHHSPGLNFAAVDSEGSIGIFAGGRLVKRSPGVDGHQLQDGASGRGDWLGYRPFEENPKKLNPAEGYAYTANHRWYFELDDGTTEPMQGYFSPDDRWMRLDERLQESGRWDLSRHTELQLDVTKPLERAMLKTGLEVEGMRALIEGQPQGGIVLERLQAWSGAYATELIAPTVMEAWTRALARAIFEDELGAESFRTLVEMHSFEDTLRRVVATPDSPWWKNGDKVLSREQILVEAMSSAFEQLRQDLGPDVMQWRWGRVHKLGHRHPFGRRSALLDQVFSIAPVEIEGGRETVNNFAMSLLDPTGQVTYGPSTRRVIYVGAEVLASTSNPVGQSIHLLDEHRADQFSRFVEGGAWRVGTLETDPSIAPAEDVLLLTPLAQ